jgi:hypothetical protein
MTEYKDIKDLIIYYDSLIGNISIDQLITEIKKSVEEQKYFEDVMHSIIENEDMSNEDISTIFNLSRTNALEMYLKIITDEL